MVTYQIDLLLNWNVCVFKLRISSQLNRCLKQPCHRFAIFASASQAGCCYNCEGIAIKVSPTGPQIPFVPRTWVRTSHGIIERPPSLQYRDHLSGFSQMPSLSACSPLSSVDPEINCPEIFLVQQNGVLKYLGRTAHEVWCKDHGEVGRIHLCDWDDFLGSEHLQEPDQRRLSTWIIDWSNLLSWMDTFPVCTKCHLMR